MADTQWLNFDLLNNDFSRTYMNSLLEPYVEALTAADTMEAIRQWVPLVLPGALGQELLDEIEDVEDVGAAKLSVLRFFGEMILLPQPERITPWTLASVRNDELTRLFGPASETLPVTAVVGPNNFAHNLSEEFTHGILHGIQDVAGFSLHLFGLRLTLDFFPDRKEGAPYTAAVQGADVDFNTPDFIQGVSTAAMWRNVDPHTLVTKLVQNGVDETGAPTETPLTF